jgi:YYY domain-containing protein
MLHFFTWYLAITLLGWLAFPLAFRLFPALSDRGYSLSRALGLLLWAYLFWLLASLGLARNDASGLLAALLILLSLSGWALWREKKEQGRLSVVHWVQANSRLVMVVEALFLTAFTFGVILRAAAPEALGTEKPMELAFINAILRSPVFPPRDPWLSGYAISYYYFGYVMAAMLAKITATPGSIAFNLMLALVLGLGAIGAYGILYNLLAKLPGVEHQTSNQNHQIPNGRGKVSTALPLLGPLFLFLVSNLEGFLEVLHRRGLFWRDTGFNFWVWLDMKELSQPPVQPLGWMPARHWWWWRASRVVQDYDLAGNFREVIDEFPFFSYLLGDLHPHVLATPFSLLMVALALNLYFGGWRGETRLPGLRLFLRPSAFACAALILGGMAFLNTFEVLTSLTLILGAYLLERVRENGWHAERLAELIELAVPLTLLAGLLYLPFYAGFSSQAGGILPNLESPTRGVHLWIMFGSLLLPIFAYLLFLWRSEKQTLATGGWIIAAGFMPILWMLSWALALLIQRLQPGFAAQYAAGQGVNNLAEFFAKATQRRLSAAGGWLTLFILLGGALSLLLGRTRRSRQDEIIPPSPAIFTLFLITIGSLLIIGPEFLYLRDQFGTRMNTVFKFYYQAWFLLGIAAAFGTAVLLQSLHNLWNSLYRLGLSIMLMMALTYPVLSIFDRTHNFNPPFGWTLDSAAYLQRDAPDEAAALTFLSQAPDGIVVEAVGGSYTQYARVATHTGLPNVLGWPGHESQWRGGMTEIGSRPQDIQTLYVTPNWNMTETIIQKYNIKYIYIGMLERNTYHLNTDKFKRFLPVVFQQGSVTIYAVP